MAQPDSQNRIPVAAVGDFPTLQARKPRYRRFFMVWRFLSVRWLVSRHARVVPPVERLQHLRADVYSKRKRKRQKPAASTSTGQVDLASNGQTRPPSPAH